MSESVYRPKSCAFHPKDQDCLLPLCPTCVDLHSEEHKQEKNYGKFINIHQVVNDITFSLESNLKELDNFQGEIAEHKVQKGVDEKQVRRKVGEAKQKVIGMVERFFKDFEKEVEKSIVEYNVSIEANYRQLHAQIKNMKVDLNQKVESLPGDRVLKTIISYFSKKEQNKNDQNLSTIRERVDELENKRISLVIDNNSIQKMFNELNQFMYLSFENWEQDIKLVSQFVKTGMSTGILKQKINSEIQPRQGVKNS